MYRHPAALSLKAKLDNGRASVPSSSIGRGLGLQVCDQAFQIVGMKC